MFKPLPHRLIVLAAVLAALFLIFDILLPLGVAGGVPYVALVLLGIWFPKSRHIYALAIIGSVFTAIGYFASSPSSELWMVITNRVLALVVIWITAILISTRKQAEEELRAMREQAEKIVEGAADAIISIDADQDIIAFNRAAEVIFGYTKNEVLGEPLDLLLPKDTARKHANLVRQFGDSKQGARWMGEREELYALRKNGELFPAEVSISKQDTSSDLILTAILKDISESRQAENALRESEERFKDFTSASSDWFWEMGPDLRFTSYSQGVEEAIGVSLDWLIGKTRQEQGRPEIDDGKWIHHLDALKAHEPFKDFEYGLIRENGTRVYVRASGVPVFRDDGEFLGYRGTGTNITDRKRTEAQLIQSSKLATLGEMATGIAHELNQPLNIINMAVESLLEEAKYGDISTDLLFRKLERIEGQVDRASAIINHMRMFGRKDSGELEVVDLKEAVQGAVGLVSEQLRLSEVGLSMDLPETCRKVMGQQLQLEQVILNLLTNARDAIKANEGSGNKPQWITISITDDPGSEEVSLCLQDTGGGIPDEVLGRVFEPFFTTKEVGEGTGLGLSISYGIITGMGGRIEVANVNGGARFTITLLAANET